MKKNVFWRFLLIGFTVVIAVIFFLPNTPLFKSMPDAWKKNMPNKGIVLGLDLQGGLHLVFEVEGDKAVEASVERFTYLIKEALQKKKLQAEVRRNGLNIEISPMSQEISTLIKENYPNLNTVSAGQNLVLTMSEKDKTAIKDNATTETYTLTRHNTLQI